MNEVTDQDPTGMVPEHWTDEHGNMHGRDGSAVIHTIGTHTDSPQRLQVPLFIGPFEGSVVGQESAGQYDHLLGPGPEHYPGSGQEMTTAVEAAAVRPQSPVSPVEAGVDRQMGIDAADRANRVAAGLPPRMFDLR